MATKTVDVTLASIQNKSPFGVSPTGTICVRTVRAVDDEQIYQNEVLYSRLDREEPMHPSGATYVPAGQSLTYNVTRRLDVSYYGLASSVNQMLIFYRDLTEYIVVTGQVHEEPYQGSYNRKVRYDEIDGFQAITLDYEAIYQNVTANLRVTYTVNLVSSSG
ncbi:hypothetical protein [Nonomuraea sp. NPDC001831]|uniref:hypothetical protein n=1 Tax=Nonomuraea sp. NPDC001831 TaxID=3364340 RepID=UPI0036863923